MWGFLFWLDALSLSLSWGCFSVETMSVENHSFVALTSVENNPLRVFLLKHYVCCTPSLPSTLLVYLQAINASVALIADAWAGRSLGEQRRSHQQVTSQT